MLQVINNVQTQRITQTQTQRLTETIPQVQYFTNTVTTHVPVYRTITAPSRPNPPQGTFTLTSTVIQECNRNNGNNVQKPQGYVLK